MTELMYESFDAIANYGSLRGPKSHKTTVSTLHRHFCQKWLMLAILSTLTATNQAICFSFAPIASIVDKRWDQRLHSEDLIAIYFISYIPCSFLASWVMNRNNLGNSLLLGGFLQAIGASLWCVACYFNSAEEAYLTILGQLLASLAMPFMVNSPVLLSVNWFPTSLRTISTSLAVTANTVGAAMVYLAAPLLEFSVDDVPRWNLYVAVAAVSFWIVAFFFFRSNPRFAAAQSSFSDMQLYCEYDWYQYADAFKNVGFWCTLLGEILDMDHFSNTDIALVGTAFIVSSLVGGQIISKYAKKKQKHKVTVQVCFFTTAIVLAAFRLVPKDEVVVTLVIVMFLGAALGSTPPIAPELGAGYLFPTSAASVTTILQICSSLLSAVMIPVLSAFRRAHTDATGHVSFYASPEWAMVLMTVATLIIFYFYNAKSKRNELGKEISDLQIGIGH